MSVHCSVCFNESMSVSLSMNYLLQWLQCFKCSIFLILVRKKMYTYIKGSPLPLFRTTLHDSVVIRLLTSREKGKFNFRWGAPVRRCQIDDVILATPLDKRMEMGSVQVDVQVDAGQQRLWGRCLLRIWLSYRGWCGQCWAQTVPPLSCDPRGRGGLLLLPLLTVGVFFPLGFLFFTDLGELGLE